MHTPHPFLDACKNGQLPDVRRMLAEDPTLVNLRDASGETPVIAALYRGQMEIVDELVASGAPLDIFAAAALGRDDRVVDLLVADPKAVEALSYDGWTPLHLAAFFGRTALVEDLIARGARVNAVSANSMRNTPLHAAVAGGRVDAALALIRHGAAVNAADAGGHTPLHIAAEGGYVPVVEALLDRGADPHVVDTEDKTPLSRAAARNHTAIVDLINLT